MGAWGTTLYDNDSASDIRGDYIDKLKRGKSNNEVTQELIMENQNIMGDVEEEPLFWFALADTQWNYGRLLPNVKERALFFLAQEEELKRWQESGQEKFDAWKNTLNNLKKKLLSTPPKEKKVSKYRLYQCKWKLGDIFAYQFNSDYSKKNGFWKKYIIIRKISEDICWPGHIVPVVQVYKWIGDDIPTLDTLRNIDLLEQGFFPSALKKHPELKKEYLITLLSTSANAIPQNQLTYLGNILGNDIIPFRGYNYYTGYTSVGWEGSGYNNNFEQYIIDMYLAWNCFYN